jgi:hypothetical protein
MFYTYLWLREDGTPYYVGKGIGRRAWRKGSPPRERVLIQEFPSEEDAFLSEKFLIALYGRKDLKEGCLINLTDGGDGTSGLKTSDSAKEKQRLAHLGKELAPEHRLAIGKAHLGKKRPPRSEGWLRKQRESHLGNRPSDETRKKMSAAQQGHSRMTPEVVQKIKEGLAKTFATRRSQ